MIRRGFHPVSQVRHPMLNRKNPSFAKAATPADLPIRQVKSRYARAPKRVTAGRLQPCGGYVWTTEAVRPFVGDPWTTVA